MPKLTKRLVENQVPAPTETFVWDSELPGFGLRVQPTGLRTYVIQYRNAEGRSRRLSIGRQGILTPDEARKLAVQKLASVARGDDPAATRKAALAAPTVDQLLDRYLSEHVAIHNARKTSEDVRRIVDVYIRPRLGGLKVAGVTRQDVIKLHRDMASTPRQANHTVAVMSKAFSLAELWALRPEASNPCRKVPRYPETHRERFLTSAELPRLGRALREAETIGLPWVVDETIATAKHLAKPENRRTVIEPALIAAVRLLLYTGARQMEILSLRWEHIDVERRTIALPGRKGGKRVAHPISLAAMEIVAALKRLQAGPWVLPRPTDAELHITKEVLHNAWQRLRRRAEIPDVNLHDLRHTVGTYASQAGANAFIIRDMLRHKTLQMTSRYANFDADPVRDMYEVVGHRLSAGLNET